MDCMSCHKEMGMNGKIFRHILICPSCKELADKAEREITREIEQAKEHALNWLETHIMRGGLLAGGSGVDEVARTTGRILSNHSSVSQVRDQKADSDRRSGDTRSGNTTDT